MEKENLYTSLKIQCAEMGVSIRDLCQRAQVPVPTVAAWKRKTPRSIAALQRLEKAIKEIKEEKGGSSEMD